MPAADGLAHVFVGHAALPKTSPATDELEERAGAGGGRMERRSLAKRACTTSSLYLYPTANDVFAANASNPITFTWDTSCLTSSLGTDGLVDLTLYAPHADQSVIKKWEGITYADGEYEVTLLPKWWNSTTSVSMQLQISPADNVLAFVSAVPGPVFEVTYPAEELVTTTVGGSTVAAAAADTGSPDPIATTVTKESSDGLPAGSIFAAVFFPVAVVVGAVVLYILYTRRRQAKKRQRWSQAVDNRMSVISSHWDRTSSHHTAGRKSGAFSQSAARRTVHSTFSAAGENFAGFGAHRADDPRDGYDYDGYDDHASSGQEQQPEMVEVVDHSAGFARPRTHFGAGGDRKSRGVSFAEDQAGSSRVSRVSFGDSLSHPKRNTVYSQGHQRSKSSLSGAMGAALRQRPSVYTNASSTSVNVLGQSAGSSAAGGRKDSVEMVLSPDQSSGPWVLGEDDVDGYRAADGAEEKLVDDSDDQRRPASQFAAVQMLGVSPSDGGAHRSSLVSRASSYGSQASASAAPAPSSPPTSPIIAPPTKAATVASYFPPPPANVTSPDDAFQAYARARSGSVAAGAPAQNVDVRRSTVGDNNPFRSSMFDATGGVGHAQ